MGALVGLCQIYIYIMSFSLAKFSRIITNFSNFCADFRRFYNRFPANFCQGADKIRAGEFTLEHSCFCEKVADLDSCRAEAQRIALKTVKTELHMTAKETLAGQHLVM